MNEGQRNAVWKTLVVLALPVGILAGERLGVGDAEDILATVCIAGVMVGVAVYIKAGGKPKDEE